MPFFLLYVLLPIIHSHHTDLDRFFREMLEIAKLELDYETLLNYTDEW